MAASYANYNADLTRTIPVTGRFTRRQRDIYNAVLRVLRGAAKAAIPGKLPKVWQKDAEALMQEELLQLHDRERKTMIFITHSIDEAIILGDRVAVMASRPGRVKEVLQVDFPRPRDPAGVRAQPRYTEIRNHIWEELRPTVIM